MTEEETERVQSMTASMEDGVEARLIDLKQRVRWAAEVAAEAGDFKDLAFARTLDKLFSETTEGIAPAPRKSSESKSNVTSTSARAGSTSQRRVPKTEPAQLERVRRILEAAPEVTSQYAIGMTALPSKFQVYAALDFAAREFGVDNLTVTELREVLKQTLRIGMPDGTLRGILSKASAAELGRIANGARETSYQLMQGGAEALSRAKLEKIGLQSQPHQTT
jgi:hypothetical protein